MSTKIKFPDNPSDKMIFEAFPGLYYQYEKGSNSWVRIDGAAALGLATPLANGLMSSDDFKKLQGLLIPPPQTSLRGENCEITYRSGKVALGSTDRSLQINDKLNLRKNGVNVPTAWSLHQNTAGIDFRLNLAKFVDDITALGNITKVQLQGDQGPKGVQGDAGVSGLDTGPVGPTGAAGVNSVFGGTLSTETLPLEVVASSQNRAIVDISTEEISPSENYLVITRANIGNPDACPDEINPQNFSSNWLLALSESTKPVSTRQTTRVDDCTTSCKTCASTLYYVNMDPILTAIRERFLLRLDLLKSSKEALVRSWLRTMVELFNEQKAALCCALENCQSRTRNTTTRQYIEQQRIQAALGNFSLVIDGANDHEVTDMDKFKSCPVPPPSPPSRVVIGQECLECALTFKLDSKQHIIDPRTGISTQSLTGYLPAGTYVASITQCCADLNIASHEFTGRCAILYRANIVNGSSIEIMDNVVNFPDFGTFDNEAAARNAYQGVTVSFEHAGGNVSIWINDPDKFGDNNLGEIDVCIQSAKCLGGASEQTASDTTGSVFIYRGDVKSGTFIGSIKPFTGNINAITNYGLSGGNAHLIHGPTLEEKKVKVFFFTGSDGLSFFYVANIANGSFQTNINSQFTVVNNALNTSVTVADGQLTQAGVGVFGGNWLINGNTEGGAISYFDPTGLWSLVIDPTNLGLITEWDAVSADGSVVILALNPNGIGGQVNGIVNTNGLSLGSPCNVPNGYGPNCGMTVYNKVAGQSVFVRKSITPVVSIPRTPNCGPGLELAATTLSGHAPNPDSASPGHGEHDNNTGVVFVQQLVFPGPGPYETLMETTPFINGLTQTLTFQCVGTVDSYADLTLMRLVDDRGVEIATNRIDHPAVNGGFSVHDFTIQAQVTRNAGDSVFVKFEANYGTLDARKSGSLLRDGTKLSIVGTKPCGPTTVAPSVPVPSVAPTVVPHKVFNNQGYIVYTTNWRVAYTFVQANGIESSLSPSTYVVQNQANLFDPHNQYDVDAIALPAGVTGVNYYISGVYNSPNDALLPFLFSAQGNGDPITLNRAANGAKQAPVAVPAPTPSTPVPAATPVTSINGIINPTVAPVASCVASTGKNPVWFAPNITVNVSYSFEPGGAGAFTSTLRSPSAAVVLNQNPAAVVVDLSSITIPPNAVQTLVWILSADNTRILQVYRAIPATNGKYMVTDSSALKVL